MSYVVVAYYTENTLYDKYAKNLLQSLEKFGLLYYIENIESQGSWWDNTAYKPTFLRRMLKKFRGTDIVYVDCDAEFLAYPKLFDNLCTLTYVNIAAYEFDRSEYGRGDKSKEVLSGTLFLKNNDKASRIVEKWEELCKAKKRTKDQRHLQIALGGNFYRLPPEYCKIFDRMEFVTEPVIVHHQASREVRQRKGRLNAKL